MSHTHSPGTALITGASAGIGAMFADRLATRGYKLILAARDAQRLAEVAHRLREKSGVQVETLACDLTVPAELALLERRLADDASISLLLNNAGSTVEGAFASCDIDKTEQMLYLNMVAPTRLARAAAGRMAAAGAGTIINLGSVTSLLPEFFSGPYSGSKAYILNLSIAMQAELAPRGVRVQAVLPGATRTEIWQRAGIDLDAFPPEMIMEVEELVDAALAGLDQGENITVPSLPELLDWNHYTEARLALRPNLSRDTAASRYRLRR